jgi:hypothetical protein
MSTDDESYAGYEPEHFSSSWSLRAPAVEITFRCNHAYEVGPDAAVNSAQHVGWALLGLAH